MRSLAQLSYLVPALALAALCACETAHQEVAPAAHQPAPHQENAKAPAGAAHQAAGGQEKMQLPPGWTEADMQACMAAGMPGAQHQQLARSVGHWTGNCSQWMAPNTEPVKTTLACEMSNFLDGRFVKCDYSGEMPGMGPFHGEGYNGFDNVSQKYVAVWMDNCGTGIMTGEGSPSADGKTMTWNYHYNCPIAKKQVSMRQVDTWTGDDTMVMEMFGADPHNGQEYKMMRCEMTRSKP